MGWLLLGLIVLGCVFWEMARRSSKDKSPAERYPSAVFKATNEATVTASKKPDDATEYAFIDLETTGLDPDSDRIIEVGVFIVKLGNPLHNGYSELVNPDRKLSDRIVELTGITDEMLSVEKNASEVLPAFFDYIGNRTVLAYNAEFDMGFLRAEAKRLGLEFNNSSSCIMEYFKTEFPQLPRHSLDAVCQAFDINIDKASHRALADAERALRVFLAATAGKQPTLATTTYGSGSGTGGRIYYVYGHYAPSGELFYVGVGHDDRAWSKDLSPIWHWYVDNKLRGKYDIKLIREKMTGYEASVYKDTLMASHADALLNRQNPHRDTDYTQQEKFHRLRDDNREQIEKATNLEKTDPETAISILRSAIRRLDEYSFMKLDGGLFGQVIADMNAEMGYKGELDALDRLTLLLCKQGRGLEAKNISEQYFAKFKADDRLKKAEAIHKRVNKKIAKAST